MEKKTIIPLSLFLIACGGTDAAHPRWAVGVWAGSDSGSLLYRAGTHAITFDTLTIAADGTGQQHRTEVTNFPGSGVLAAARKALAAGESRTAVEAAVLKQTGLSLKQLEDGAAPVTSVTAGSFRWFVTVDTATNTAKVCAVLDGYAGRTCGDVTYETDTLRVVWDGRWRMNYHRLRP